MPSLWPQLLVQSSELQTACLHVLSIWPPASVAVHQFFPRFGRASGLCHVCRGGRRGEKGSQTFRCVPPINHHNGSNRACPFLWCSGASLWHALPTNGVVNHESDSPRLLDVEERVGHFLGQPVCGKAVHAAKHVIASRGLQRELLRSQYSFQKSRMCVFNGRFVLFEKGCLQTLSSCLLSELLFGQSDNRASCNPSHLLSQVVVAIASRFSAHS